MAAPPDPAVSTGWTRSDWIGLLARLTDGFVRAIPAGRSPAAACLPGRAEPDRVPWIEGFARMSVGWAAWLHEPSNPAVLEHDGRRHDVAALLARGLADATHPSHPAWWGPIGDRDQRIVEAAEIGTTLLLGGDRLRAALAALDPSAPGRVVDWIGGVDGRDVWPDNWVLFPMIVALAQKAHGRLVPHAAIDDAIDWMLAHHVGDGWSSDGRATPWISTPAGRSTGTSCGGPGSTGSGAPARGGGRAPGTGVAGGDGRARRRGRGDPRFGRSLGYRFAFAAPFAQAAFLGIDPLGPGVARRIASGMVERSVADGAIDPATDWLRVGVGAERPAVVEGYVTPGAVAWAAHAFVALAMPATDPFWAAPEAGLPSDRGAAGCHAAGRAGLLGSWTAAGDTRLHNARSGHPADIPGHDYSATYAKLAYRSAFPCDVPVRPGASAGSDDAVTAIEAGPPRAEGAGDRIVHRAETDAGSAGPGWIVARYRLATTGGGVAVTTVVLVLDEAEIRVSLVGASPRPIRIRDGGPVLDGPVVTREAAEGAVVLGSAAGGLVGRGPCWATPSSAGSTRATSGRISSTGRRRTSPRRRVARRRFGGSSRRPTSPSRHPDRGRRRRMPRASSRSWRRSASSGSGRPPSW